MIIDQKLVEPQKFRLYIPGLIFGVNWLMMLLHKHTDALNSISSDHQDI